ncbi:phosphoribosylanthranilate isomerase [Flavobacterium sp. N2820]|uniref:phosphoribosylanthranilate isomerase n=1 Tax=Flavobacterium sp. N2820 TaxID=2986834 RepID=UPI002224EE5C|nr:phosphoribosylanthranilate isomerase [Flavobacterium sp. N2820]
MKNIKLKICGMKYHENIVEISALQPDYLGFIFWEKSIRNMDIESIPKIQPSIKKVGVFVDASIDEIRAKVNLFQLDIIQLHGNETIAFCKELKKLNIEIIKVFSINNFFDFSILKDFIPQIDYFLFDTKGKLPGGNGITFDWKILENYPYEKPFFLSGGIGKTEVDAIKDFFQTEVAKKCIAIDVNSRFETKPAYKSEIKLRKFKKLLCEITYK